MKRAMQIGAAVGVLAGAWFLGRASAPDSGRFTFKRDDANVLWRMDGRTGEVMWTFGALDKWHVVPDR